jgi:hypothetical protein
MADQLGPNRQSLLRRVARDLLRELDRVAGPDKPETQGTLRDVAAAIEARREDWPPELLTARRAACHASPAAGYRGAPARSF